MILEIAPKSNKRGPNTPARFISTRMYKERIFVPDLLILLLRSRSNYYQDFQKTSVVAAVLTKSKVLQGKIIKMIKMTVGNTRKKTVHRPVVEAFFQEKS